MLDTRYSVTRLQSLVFVLVMLTVRSAPNVHTHVRLWFHRTYQQLSIPILQFMEFFRNVFQLIRIFVHKHNLCSALILHPRNATDDKNNSGLKQRLGDVPSRLSSVPEVCNIAQQPFERLENSDMTCFPLHHFTAIPFKWRSLKLDPISTQDSNWTKSFAALPSHDTASPLQCRDNPKKSYTVDL